MTNPSFRDIPQFTRQPSYRVSEGWDSIEDWITRQSVKDSCRQILNLDPDFQRAHVWTETQQIRYIEYILQGGKSGAVKRANMYLMRGLTDLRR